MFERLKGLFTSKPAEQRSFEPFDPNTSGFGSAFPSSAGTFVSSDNALSVSTIMSIIRGISSPIAAMPMFLRQTISGKHQTVAMHPLSYLLAYKPNPYQTSYQWREQVLMNLLLWGNHYSIPKYNRRGECEEIFPLQPIYVQAFAMETNSGALRIDQLYYNGEVIYRWMTPSMGVEWIPRNEMLHIMGLTKNGIFGINPIEYAREDVGLSLAGRTAAALSFGQGVNPGGILEAPEKLSDKAYDRLKDAANRASAGLQNTGKPMILEEGMKWNWNTLDNVKLQSLESRNFQRAELCAMYNYPLYKAGDMTKANFSNNEQQDTEFLYNTLLSWVQRTTQCMNTQLLSKKELAAGFHIDIDYHEYIKGDSAARSNYNQKAITTGWMTPNEARAAEGMDLSDDPEADKLHFPLNLGNPADQPKQADTIPADVKKDVTA